LEHHAVERSPRVTATPRSALPLLELEATPKPTPIGWRTIKGAEHLFPFPTVSRSLPEPGGSVRWCRALITSATTLLLNSKENEEDRGDED
jgi:hypothetical protein